ncbi:MAG TPA: glycosyltransferase family 4 protein [Gemmatimonadota bacterium]|nr:glycosyltransferase family 4 protein [Gemmatimonadota bacterium]
MRVLLVTDWYPRHRGSEGYVAWLRNGLLSAGDEVRLLTSSAGRDFAGDGKADYVAFGTERRPVQAFLQIVNPFAVGSIRSALRDFVPDVVFVNLFEHQLSPAILHVLRGVPTVLGVTDYKCICPIAKKLLPDGSICLVQAGWVCCRGGCVSLPHWIRDRPRYALLRTGLDAVDRVLACSRWMQRELASAGILSEWVTLPIPRPAIGFSRAPAREPLFLFVGRLEVQKGVPGLLRAFARVRVEVPSARLRIVGDGSQRAVLERMTGALALQDSVRWTGWQDPTEVERELAAAWVLVAPSLWAEPLGFVALEAMVRGVPVVASEKGGFGETVEHGVSGFLVPNGDEEALAGRMLDIARRRAFRSHVLPNHAVQRVTERHSMENHVERMRGIFREVAGR